MLIFVSSPYLFFVFGMLSFLVVCLYPKTNAMSTKENILTLNAFSKLSSSLYLFNFLFLFPFFLFHFLAKREILFLCNPQLLFSNLFFFVVSCRCCHYHQTFCKRTMNNQGKNLLTMLNTKFK